MKRGRVSKLALVFVLILSLFVPHVAYASDYNNHWARYDIETLKEKGIMGGYPDGTFKPNQSITRAEFTKLLLGAIGITATNSSSPFKDVKPNDWFYADVVTAYREGLVSGMSETQFSPNSKITREQMAVMIQRALEYKGISSRESAIVFADEKKIASWAKPSVKRLYFLGIINGKDKKVNFAPKDHATRAETAAIIVRMLNVIDDPRMIIGYTNYNYDFKAMVDAQMRGTPKVDGAGKYLASRAMVEYYANPNNFDRNSSDFMQFLVLSERSGVSAKMINDSFLKGKGILEGQADAFLEAGKRFNVNEIYLIAHALHETGNGTSPLAQGIEVGKTEDDQLAVVTNENRDKLKDIRKVYNMYGVGAIDTCPNACGAAFAYENGWFTPAEAIVGGAEFILGYIQRGQDTLYKMRWNPDSPGYPQYATHVMWATIQAKKIQDMYNQISGYTLKFDVPKFNNQPGKTPLPQGVAQYGLDTKLAGEKGRVNVTDTPLRLREGPTTNFNVITTLAHDTEVTILGENGGWYKVKVNGKEGWVSGDYIVLDKDVKASALGGVEVIGDTKDAQVDADQAKHVQRPTGESRIPGEGIETSISVDTALLRTAPVSGDNVIAELTSGTKIVVIDVEDGWYFVEVDGVNGWVASEDVNLE